VILIFTSLSSIKFCLSIYGVFYFIFGGIFEFIYFKKYHIFYVNYAYFFVLFFYFSTGGVCSGGKLRKSSQVLYRSDQGKYFLKNKSNYFAHICPEYGFRVKIYPVNFQHRYSSLQCHDPSEIISNMMIWCSENISDYYQFCKQLCCPKIVWKPRFPKVCIIF